MAKKNVGTLIKEARTAAGLSQTALAEKVDGVSASDIGKAERGEKELTQAQLKAVAKALGVTQKSLLEAPKGGTNTSGKTTAKKPASSGSSSSSAKKPASSSSAKKPASSSSGKKTDSKKSDDFTLTATEKKHIPLH